MVLLLAARVLKVDVADHGPHCGLLASTDVVAVVVRPQDQVLLLLEVTVVLVLS